MHEEACTALHEVLNKMPRHYFGRLNEAVPADGVYFLFEAGETGHGGERLVRIGSHTGKSNLASRLREHVRSNKDRSIFRKHIGRALLKRDNDPYLGVWNLDLTSRKAREEFGHRLEADKQDEVEQAVSNYICKSFSIVVLPASDSTAACRLEELCIGTVSCCSRCSPSDTWLGRHADPRIGHSGLWQIMHLYRQGLEIADLRGVLSGTGQ
jgi:hypothetical protein